VVVSSSYRDTLNQWLLTVEVKAFSVLDIGGSQEKVKDRVKSWDVEHYTIADLADPHAESPQPDIVMDLNKRFQGDIVPQEMIFCLEVFDYVYDPMTAFKNIQRWLDHGGVAWVTFPFAYPLHNPYEDDSLRYTEFGIRRLAKAAYLDIEQIIIRKPETDLLNRFYVGERMRALKHYDHNYTGFIVKFKNQI
jgi:hypothetical protein